MQLCRLVACAQRSRASFNCNASVIYGQRKISAVNAIVFIVLAQTEHVQASAANLPAREIPRKSLSALKPPQYGRCFERLTSMCHNNQMDNKRLAFKIGPSHVVSHAASVLRAYTWTVQFECVDLVQAYAVCITHDELRRSEIFHQQHFRTKKHPQKVLQLVIHGSFQFAPKDLRPTYGPFRRIN